MRDGFQNASALIIIQGYLISTGVQCKINSPRSGIYPVKWMNMRMPNGIKLGSKVTLIGQLVTLDLGRAFVIIKAEALKPGKLPAIKKFLEEQK